MWQLVSEERLPSLYSNDIADCWHDSVTRGHFSGVADVRIEYAYAIPESPRASIVFSSGRIETLLKYKAFFYECYINGIALFMLDHRGQGLSGRMIEDSQRGFVHHFDDFSADMAGFVTSVVQPALSLKPSLVCHSMGSAIGFLTAHQNPDLFSKAVFCSPMFGVKPSIPAPLLSVLLSGGLTANHWLGRKPWYALGQHAYIDIPFALNTLTHSPIRYKLFKEEYKRHPEVQLGGVTYHWLAAATEAMNRIETEAHRFALETLVLVSGSDKVVDNQRILRVAERLPHAQIIQIEGARHELLFEQDKYRHPALTAILDFVTASAK
ncbi:alpha/beta fold hydrolase [Alteromonas oceanisediminis]|uniref:alpha/beta fold hydrolase n=1 Tax=Alteromonas oceanisediminis TaxID=2836180 RepID=UPI001BDA8660|nr:alpha/beta fold hydrolase [Alteromonas oceanisediminis]MBT0586073.1 alpha/beta fold hydrolase [Alteromonas oceanisediminis]